MDYTNEWKYKCAEQTKLIDWLISWSSADQPNEWVNEYVHCMGVSDRPIISLSIFFSSPRVCVSIFFSANSNHRIILIIAFCCWYFFCLILFCFQIVSRVQNSIDYYEHQRKHTNRIGRAELLLCLTLSWKWKKNSNGTLITVDWYFYRVFICVIQTVYRPSAVCYHFRIGCNYLDVLFSVVFRRKFIFFMAKWLSNFIDSYNIFVYFFCIDTHN